MKFNFTQLEAQLSDLSAKFSKIIKISGLPFRNTYDGTETFPVNVLGEEYQMPVSVLNDGRFRATSNDYVINELDGTILITEDNVTITIPLNLLSRFGKTYRIVTNGSNLTITGAVGVTLNIPNAFNYAANSVYDITKIGANEYNAVQVNDGDAVAGVIIEDVLNSTSTINAASANTARLLNEKIEGLGIVAVKTQSELEAAVTALGSNKGSIFCSEGFDINTEVTIPDGVSVDFRYNEYNIGTSGKIIAKGDGFLKDGFFNCTVDGLELQDCGVGRHRHLENLSFYGDHLSGTAIKFDGADPIGFVTSVNITIREFLNGLHLAGGSSFNNSNVFLGLSIYRCYESIIVASNASENFIQGSIQPWANQDYGLNAIRSTGSGNRFEVTIWDWAELLSDGGIAVYLGKTDYIHTNLNSKFIVSPYTERDAPHIVCSGGVSLAPLNTNYVEPKTTNTGIMAGNQDDAFAYAFDRYTVTVTGASPNNSNIKRMFDPLGINSCTLSNVTTATIDVDFGTSITGGLKTIGIIFDEDNTPTTSVAFYQSTDGVSWDLIEDVMGGDNVHPHFCEKSNLGGAFQYLRVEMINPLSANIKVRRFYACVPALEGASAPSYLFKSISSSSDDGVEGQVFIDGDYIKKYDGGQWKRASLTFSTF